MTFVEVAGTRCTARSRMTRVVAESSGCVGVRARSRTRSCANRWRTMRPTHPPTTTCYSSSSLMRRSAPSTTQTGLLLATRGEKEADGDHPYPFRHRTSPASPEAGTHQTSRHCPNASGDTDGPNAVVCGRVGRALPTPVTARSRSAPHYGCTGVDSTRTVELVGIWYPPDAVGRPRAGPRVSASGDVAWPARTGTRR